MTGSAQSTVCGNCTASHCCATLKYGRAGGGPGTAVRRLHGGRVRRSPSDSPTLARSEPRAPRPRDLGPRAGSPPYKCSMACRLMQHRDGPEPCQISLRCSVDSRLRLPPSHAGFSTPRRQGHIPGGEPKSLLSSKLGETPRVGSRRSDKPRSDTPSPRARTYVATTGKATVTGPAFSPITNSRSRDSALLTRGLINPACSGVIRPISRVEELGSAAPGRRVNLPWHPSRSGFKLTTGDGTLIRQ